MAEICLSERRHKGEDFGTFSKNLNRYLVRCVKCVTDLHGNAHHLLVYVNPTKGRWSPEKAVWEGGGMVS